jgi:hypothetical protein
MGRLLLRLSMRMFDVDCRVWAMLREYIRISSQIIWKVVSTDIFSYRRLVHNWSAKRLNKNVKTCLSAPLLWPPDMINNLDPKPRHSEPHSPILFARVAVRLVFAPSSVGGVGRNTSYKCGRSYKDASTNA